MRLVLLASSLALAPGCLVDGDPATVSSPDGPPPGSVTSTTFSSDTSITSPRELQGRNNVIEAGVTVTVSGAGSLAFASNAVLEVLGTLVVEGTAEAPIDVHGVAGQPNFAIEVGQGGTLDLRYAVVAGGAHTTVGGATVSIEDTLLFGSPQRDLITMNGGSVTVKFSQFGAPDGVVDSTHCNLHLGGLGNTLVVNNSILHGTPYNLMLYAGTNIDLKNNNWTCGPNGAADCAAHIDVDSQPGVSADLTGSFFEKGDPVASAAATLRVSDPPIAAPLTDVGVRLE